MKIDFNERSPKWRKINSVNEWIDSFQNSKKNEEGHSALTLAKFCRKPDVESILKDWLKPIFQSDDFILETAIPEKSSQFDDFGKQRIHDLAISGKTISGKTIFVGVEAKVNETYSSTVNSAYNKAKKDIEQGKRTKMIERIDNLITKYFPTISIDSEIRYQLLYAVAGTLCEHNDYNILLFLTFRTKEYTEKAATRNKNDLNKFLDEIDSKEMMDGYYRCQFNSQTLYIVCKEVEGNL